MAYIWIWIGTVLAAPITVYGAALILTLTGRVAVVRQSSMEPTLREGEYVLLRAIRRDAPIRRMDIVILDDPRKADGSGRRGRNRRRLIKRVIGLPGERLEIGDGRVYINGRELADEFGPTRFPGIAGGGITLGPDQYFVLGDNRGISLDSRSFGPISRVRIVRRVEYRIPWIKRRIRSNRKGEEQE